MSKLEGDQLQDAQKGLFSYDHYQKRRRKGERKGNNTWKRSRFSIMGSTSAKEMSALTMKWQTLSVLPAFYESTIQESNDNNISGMQP